MRSRSSVGRSASSVEAKVPDRPTVRHSVVRAPSGPWRVVARSAQVSDSLVRTRSVPSISIRISKRPSRANRRVSPVRFRSSRTRSTAASSRRTMVTAVSWPSVTVPLDGKGRRSMGTCPVRRCTSAARVPRGSFSAIRRSTVSLADSAWKRTAPDAEATVTSSLSATTAEKPTPKRPAEEGSALLVEARRVARDSTPSGVRGAPVLAATRRSPSKVKDSRPGTFARCAASAAFCASSTTTRSR